VPVTRTKILLSMTTAFGAWLVGSINILRSPACRRTRASGLEFQYIIAAVIGGCLLTGGFGSAVGRGDRRADLRHGTPGHRVRAVEQRLVHAVPRR